jgi:hypothetical protein
MSSVRFVCPIDGDISQDDVLFLCNNCRQEELIYKNDIYICPACLVPGENFECLICGSKEVKMRGIKVNPSDVPSQSQSTS